MKTFLNNRTLNQAADFDRSPVVFILSCVLNPEASRLEPFYARLLKIRKQYYQYCKLLNVYVKIYCRTGANEKYYLMDSITLMH